jgi:hypothetical protein
VWSIIFYTHPTAYAFKQWAVERKKRREKGEGTNEKRKRGKQHLCGVI